MKIYIYESDNPKKYSANFFADAFLKYTSKSFIPTDYPLLPRDKNGKPKPIMLPDKKLLHFSISHSGKYWGTAFNSKPIGFDLETKLKQGKPREFSTKFLQKILTKDETLIENSPLHNFVAKEAYSKLTGEGLSLGFSKIDANELIKQYHPYSLEDDQLILYAFTTK